MHVNRFETIVVEYMDLNGNSLKKAFKDLESIKENHLKIFDSSSFIFNNLKDKLKFKKLKD